MWVQIGKIVVLICIILVLLIVGGFVGMACGFVIGVVYLPVKILSVIRETCDYDPGIIKDDEI